MSYLSSVLPLAFITGTKTHLFSPQLFIKSCAIHHISVSLKIMKRTESLPETIWKLKKVTISKNFEQMSLLISLIAICSNLKYGYRFPFCRKALTLLKQEMGSSKSQRSLKWGTQEYKEMNRKNQCWQHVVIPCTIRYHSIVFPAHI